MIGAICGDILGSVYEHAGIKTKEFGLLAEGAHFTDDSVLTIAIAEAIRSSSDYAASLREIGCKYPDAGYGGTFYQWLFDEKKVPYNSWGNGSAMRVSPVGWVYSSIDEVLQEAEKSAACTHNHPEGIKGAQAVALSVLLARKGASKDEIRNTITTRFNYDLSRTVDSIRDSYRFEISCQKSVPESIIAFLDSEDYEDAVRNAISLGGDADTQACIAGAIAEAYFGNIPEFIMNFCLQKLDSFLLSIAFAFLEGVQHDSTTILSAWAKKGNYST